MLKKIQGPLCKMTGCIWIRKNLKRGFREGEDSGEMALWFCPVLMLFQAAILREDNRLERYHG